LDMMRLVQLVNGHTHPTVAAGGGTSHVDCTLIEMHRTDACGPRSFGKREVHQCGRARKNTASLVIDDYDLRESLNSAPDFSGDEQAEIRGIA